MYTGLLAHFLICSLQKFVYLPCCYYALQEIQKYEFWTTSSGMTPITDFEKISQLLQTLTGGHIQTQGGHLRTNFLFQKGKWILKGPRCLMLSSHFSVDTYLISTWSMTAVSQQTKKKCNFVTILENISTKECHALHLCIDIPQLQRGYLRACCKSFGQSSGRETSSSCPFFALGWIRTQSTIS
jgi:hypothetical protein